MFNANLPSEFQIPQVHVEFGSGNRKKVYRRPNVGNVVEHLEGILPLDVVILDLRHVDVEYDPDTSLKERL